MNTVSCVCTSVELIIFYLLTAPTWTHESKVSSIRNDQLCPNPMYNNEKEEQADGKGDRKYNFTTGPTTLKWTPDDVDMDRERFINVDSLLDRTWGGPEENGTVKIQAVLLSTNPWIFKGKFNETEDAIPCKVPAYYKFKLDEPSTQVPPASSWWKEDKKNSELKFYFHKTVILSWSQPQYLQFIFYSTHLNSDDDHCVVTLQQYVISQYPADQKCGASRDSCGHYRCGGSAINNIATQLQSDHVIRLVPEHLYQIDPPLPGLVVETWMLESMNDEISYGLRDEGILITISIIIFITLLGSGFYFYRRRGMTTTGETRVDVNSQLLEENPGPHPHNYTAVPMVHCNK